MNNRKGSRSLQLEIFILSLLVWVVVGQEKQCTRQYSGEVERCNAFVPSGITIYVKNFTTYDELISSLLSETAQISAIPGECSELMMRYTCRSRLTECVQQVGLAFPRPNCMDVCTEASTKCDYIFIFGGKSADCDGYDNSGLPLFIDSSVTYTGSVNGTEVKVNCSNSVVGEYEAICSFPQAKKKNGQCGIACPDPMYTKEEYRGVFLMSKIGGWISFFLLLAVCITYAVDPRKKSWPSNIPYLICFGAMVHSFFMVVFPTFYDIGKENNSFLCSDAATPVKQEDANGACIMQAVSISYTVLHINGLLIAWSSVIIYQMLNIKKRGEMLFYPWGAVICGLVYILPLIPIVVAASYGRIGYPRGSQFCTFWMSEDINEEFRTRWSAGTIVIPSLIMCSVTCILLVIVMFLLYRAFKKVANLRKSKKSNFAYEKKMIQYLLLNLLNQLSLFAFYFDSVSKEDDITKGYQEWITCLAADPAGDCSLKVRPALSLVVISTLCAVIYGGVGVFVFGLHIQVWRYWVPCLGKFASKTLSTESKAGSKMSSERDTNIELSTVNKD